MDYETKYKETLEMAKEAYYSTETPYLAKAWLLTLFPMIAENEDERIRKWIITQLEDMSGSTDIDKENKIIEAITWLEKQHVDPYNGVGFDCYGHHWSMCARDNGIEISMDRKPIRHFSYKDCEQIFGGKSAIKKEKVDNQNCIKSVDKVNLKFHPGDWAILNGTVAQILDKQKYGFVGLDIDGKDFFCNYGHIDSMRLWTITDANDGDILSREIDGEIFIFLFNQIQDKWIVAYGYYSETADEFIEKAYFGRYHEDSFSPATKEQRDLFFSKIKEAGYEWDTEKKELRKIESKTFDTNNVLPSLGNNRVQDILEDMGMLDDNGQCPYTVEEIFKAGIEYAYNLNREAVSNVKFDASKINE